MIPHLNQKGIALVTALMLTLISLAIISALLIMILRGVQTSASEKKYRTALEATYGGTEITMKDVTPLVFQGYSGAQLSAKFAGVDDMTFPSGTACFHQKLTLPTSLWSSSCSQTLNPTSSPDVSFKLKGINNSNAPYTVYAKYVDSTIGNTDISGLQLEGSGVAEASAIITPKHFPNVYRLEVRAERSATTEQANISVLYAY
jgi:hypothetical protein